MPASSLAPRVSPAASAMTTLASCLPLLAYAACALPLLRVLLCSAPLLLRWWRFLGDALHPHHHYKIPRYDENLRENPLYRSAAAYVSSLPSLEDSNYANIFSSSDHNHLRLRLDDGHSVEDTFLGARVSWTNLSDAVLLLRVRRADRRRVLRPYLDHVAAVAEEVALRRRELRLYTNCAPRRWASVPFTHPATLDALAVDPDLKARVRADLELFLRSRARYHRLGRVWRRSYLLYGPPGTGKSRFAAAMARFLGYDVYDLDPARATDGAELKALLLQTTSRSVILVEDLDRYLLAGPPAGGLHALMGFMDGMFSCCGEQRVVVFTMNGVKEKVDAAVLRPGRADVHVYFSLCDFRGFKAMASGYLGIKEHKLYPQVEEAFQSAAARLSQAEVGEIMLANRGSPGRALRTVISALRRQQQVVGAAEVAGTALLGRVRWGAGEEGTPVQLRKVYGLVALRSGRGGGGGFGRLFHRNAHKAEK